MDYPLYPAPGPIWYGTGANRAAQLAAPDTNMTAWWGFCFECRLHFGNHMLGCSHLGSWRPWDNSAAAVTTEPWRQPDTTGARGMSEGVSHVGG